MILRPYQRQALDQLYDWFEENHKGNPCIVLPTGSGKSHVIAELCKEAIQQWSQTRILMLTHSMELIEQNTQKMLDHWPEAPLGIYAAGLNKRESEQSIVFAGIQSVANSATFLGHRDLIIIDEAHSISHKDEGRYRTLLNALTFINPRLRIAGLTATPFRLGHGLITQKPALFDALIEPVGILDLVSQGYLAPLRSKLTGEQFDISRVKKRGGEYVERDLQIAVDRDDKNQAIIQEIILRAEGRKAWLIFCAGVKHAHNIANELSAQGIRSACITSQTPKAMRNRLIAEFRRGERRALTNANVLTTGFDYPDIDLIAMLRPTMSPGLYMQMAGRGLRLKSHTDHCLVLDFAGVVKMHGPITSIKMPELKNPGNGPAPVKVCDNCQELVALSARVCPACGMNFPEPTKEELKLRHDVDIMGGLPDKNQRLKSMDVIEWVWREHTSKSTGEVILAVSYYGAKMHDKITEYFPILYSGYAGTKAMNTVAGMVRTGADIMSFSKSKTVNHYASAMNGVRCPTRIYYKVNGKYPSVMQRLWEDERLDEENQDTISH